MARYKARRQNRYEFLLSNAFTPLESRELSILSKATPALKQMVADRRARRERFDQIASWKIARGQWRESDLQGKWLTNLSRMYRKRDWRVKQGATGAQKDMPKGSPNPWAMYRGAIKDTGGDKGQGWVSPWMLRQIAKGKTPLEKGTLFVRKAVVSGASAPMLKDWIRQLDKSIRAETSAARKQQLTAQRDRLQKLVA